MDRKGNHTLKRLNAIGDTRAESGFTLIELLVVVSILSVLMSIALPVLGSVKRRMDITRCMVHSRQVTFAELAYAQDNDGRFAETLATIVTGSHCDPYYPNTLVNVDSWPREYRNQSEYFRTYLNKPWPLDCPEAPGRSRWLAEAWQAGDNWRPGHWLMGTKCFWRNFKGLSEHGRVVEGPKTVYRRREGKALVSCLLNYGRRGTTRLISSAHFPGASSASPSLKSNFLWPNFWVRDVPETELDVAMQSVRLEAGYVDGHVESRNASDTMGVWIVADRYWLPTKPELSRGKYFLPTGGLR